MEHVNNYNTICKNKEEMKMSYTNRIFEIENTYTLSHSEKQQQLLALYREGSEADDACCRYLLAYHTLSGAERAAALRECRDDLAAAAETDPVAAYHYARAHYKYPLKEEDNAVYVKYQQIAADAGHTMALFAMACEYFRGERVPRDLALSDAYCLKAAMGGHPIACCEQGMAHEQGVNRKVDLEKAREWYEKAAACGEKRGRLGLARLQMKVDPEGARTAFEALLEAGTVGAAYYLGALCEARGELERAVAYYERCGLRDSKHFPFVAVSEADAYEAREAMLALGECYRSGKGVQADPWEAARYFGEAAYMDSHLGVEPSRALERLSEVAEELLKHADGQSASGPRMEVIALKRANALWRSSARTEK